MSKQNKKISLDQLKIPPHSFEAEQSVIGGLLLDGNAWDSIADLIVEQDFYRNDNRVIFRSIAALAGQAKSIDVITVIEHLRALNLLEEAGSEIYLYELVRNTPSIANIVAYTEVVRERSILRKLLSAAHEIADQAYHTQGRPVSEILDISEQKIFEIAEKRTTAEGPVHIKQLATKTLNNIDNLCHSKEKITGLATGFYDLDDLTAGLQRSDLIIIAGRPSMGKTGFAMNIVENVIIKLKKTALVFSMEMPGDALVTRAIASLAGVDLHRIRTGKLNDNDWPRIRSQVGLLTEAPLLIDDTPGLSPIELRARARRVAREQGELGMIVIDYLQLMHVPGAKENRTLEISEISRSLKSLARELNVPIVALSQLNRSLEQRSDRRPMMSDLRESGAIEQDADLITFIYRDEVYNEDSSDKGVAEIIVAKHRNGPIGKVRLKFEAQYTRFRNLAPGEMQMNTSLPRFSRENQ